MSTAAIYILYTSDPYHYTAVSATSAAWENIAIPTCLACLPIRIIIIYY